MTPKLAMLIRACTCGKCHGEGKLVSSQVLKNVFGQHVRQTETHDCDACDGTGVQSMGDDE